MQTIPFVNALFNVSVEQSVISPLLCQTVKDDVTNEDVLVYNRDVSLLFNQQRLEQLGGDSLTSYVKQLRSSVASYGNQFNGMSDDELLSFCKSRYVQSPSELKRYCEKLDGYGRSVLDGSSALNDAQSSNIVANG